MRADPRKEGRRELATMRWPVELPSAIFETAATCNRYHPVARSCKAPMATRAGHERDDGKEEKKERRAYRTKVMCTPMFR